MPHTDSQAPSAKRVALYRKKARRRGLQRLELSLLQPDAALIREAASQIRSGGAAADRMRRSITEAKEPAPGLATTGKELYAMFRASPLVGADIAFERDKSLPRDADLF